MYISLLLSFRAEIPEVMTDQKCSNDLDFSRLIDLVLGYAVSSPGQGHIVNLQPFTACGELVEELETVFEMRSILESESEDFTLDFHPLDDEFKLLGIQGAFLSGSALKKIEKLLLCSRCLRRSSAITEDSTPRVWKIARKLHVAMTIEERIRSAIDDNGEVNDSASRRLGALRRKFVSSRKRVLNLLERIRTRIGPDVESAEGEITLRNSRYVIPVRTGSHIKVPGIVHDRSKSGATQYIEPQETIELNNALREAELEIHQEIISVLRDLSSELRPFVEDLSRNQEILGMVDSIRARARFSLDYDCSIPNVVAGGPLRLKGARHPLLGEKGSGGVVPLDLEMEEDERSLLVSGPNAGGKTVLLKTVGLLAMMTHHGIPPPLKEGSGMPFLKSIYTDIGDDQSIENDLSTFSSKVKVLKDVLSGADGQSLVLLDEVGSGTDPSEGQALALSVIEELTGRGSLNIFTTHYGEVKGIAGKKRGVINGSMGFDHATIEPTYRFKKGTPGKSFGLEIAERLGLDRGVVERARKWVPDTHIAMEELIGEWEKKREDILEREAETRNKELFLSAQLSEWKAGELTREEQRQSELRRAEAEVERMMFDARDRIEGIISGLEQAHQGDSDLIRQARQDIEREIYDIRKRRGPLGVAQDDGGDSQPLHPGDVVLVESLEDEGTVLALDGRVYTVKIGNLRVGFPRSALKKIRSAGGRKTGPIDQIPKFTGDSGSSGSGEGISREVDIRGILPDEVNFRVQKAIDTALLQGIASIMFIHGKGKGVLREKVAEVLRSEIRITSFRTGQHGEGGTGVTVAKID